MRDKLVNMNAFRSLVALAVVLVALVAAAPATAESGWWHLTSTTRPGNLPPGGIGEIDVGASDLGEASVSGETVPITIGDTLPAGLKATAISGNFGIFNERPDYGVKCSLEKLRCEFTGTFPPFERLEVYIAVTIEPGAVSGAANQASISGGESVSSTGGQAPATSINAPVTISGQPTPFGVERYELTPEEPGGVPDRQAGSHPFQLTATISLNQVNQPSVVYRGSGPETVQSPYSAALVKDLHFELPAGVIGNPTVVPKCTIEQFLNTKQFYPANGCPPETAVGAAQLIIDGTELAESGRALTIPVPLFNLAPSPGEPAQFGFQYEGRSVYLDTAVRTGGDYGVTVNVKNITQQVGFIGSQVTFWGVPGDPRHDHSRGWPCLVNGEYVEAGAPVGHCSNPQVPNQIPFLTMPTSCTGQLETTVLADSWVDPGDLVPKPYTFQNALGEPFGMDGCGKLSFSPSISVAPDGTEGSSPTGLTVGLHVPQENDLVANGLAESEVRDTTVALPEGVQLSPSAADGLLSCSQAQIGLQEDAAPTCPAASKVGTVQIKTPLLPNPLEGSLYLAAQEANPFGSLIALYLVAEDPVSGVLVKLAGKVTPNLVTGQLVSTFEETPQLPFSDLTLHFFGSARAPLTTPSACGSYTTTTSITPWSGDPAVDPSSSFDITSGPNGSPCSSPLPFTPGFQAGSTNLQAGAFTPFTLTMTRPDGDQTLSRVEMQMPPGLLGTLSNVKLCGEPQAAQGTCGPESLIGETTVSAGLGGDPYTVTGGKVYITGPYKGAPYGLSIVNPAVAGPFNLGTVVVRATIEVNPYTAALSIKSDPLPTILDGIPLQIQRVNVTISREKFTFNPTNCDKTAIDGTLSSTEGVAAPVSTSFQVTNCANLAFDPKFAVSSSGKTSRKYGASLHVKLTYPTGPYDANISKVKVDLPKQLPSRLTTLQKACTAKQFEANPAGCPKESVVGTAKAITPVLPVPLEGPAYFVSHGGEAFPSLIVVLQGYGTTVDLVGTTFISKAGITSSTFKTVPDVPVGSFELTLPEGKYSALAANGNLCKSKLVMPTAFVGQNGMEIHESTGIEVEGCSGSLSVMSSKVKKRTVTLSVYAPAAGKITASGKGLSSGSKSYSGREALSFTLKQKKEGRLKTKIKLTFTPSTGKKQTKTVKASFKH